MSFHKDHKIPDELDEETQKKYITEFLELFKSISSRIGDPTEAELRRLTELSKYINGKIRIRFDKALGAAGEALGVIYTLPLIF